MNMVVILDTSITYLELYVKFISLNLIHHIRPQILTVEGLQLSLSPHSHCKAEESKDLKYSNFPKVKLLKNSFKLIML